MPVIYGENESQINVIPIIYWFVIRIFERIISPFGGAALQNRVIRHPLSELKPCQP
jgi:hypothetical protein